MPTINYELLTNKEPIKALSCQVYVVEVSGSLSESQKSVDYRHPSSQAYANTHTNTYRSCVIFRSVKIFQMESLIQYTQITQRSYCQFVKIV